MVNKNNKLTLKDLQHRHRSDRESELMINQSDLSRHGGHSALNDEFIDMKNRRVNFSSKKKDFGKMDHHFSGFNTSLPLTFNDADRDSDA